MYYGYNKNKRVVNVAVLREANIKELPELDMDEVEDEHMVEGKVDPPLILIVEI